MSCLLYRGQDFEKAGSLRDKEMELKAQISKITNQAKESEQAEVESGDNTGPMVTEADIANIVAQWTGKHCATPTAFLVGSLCCSVCDCVAVFALHHCCRASSAVFCYAPTAVVQNDKQDSPASSASCHALTCRESSELPTCFQQIYASDKVHACRQSH